MMAETPANTQQIAAKRALARKVCFSPLTESIMFIILMLISGSSVNNMTIIFSSLLVTAFFRHLSRINAAFRRCAGLDARELLLFKLVYVAACLSLLAIAAYKFHKMGILPTRPADFLPMLKHRAHAQAFLN